MTRLALNVMTWHKIHRTKIRIWKWLGRIANKRTKNATKLSSFGILSLSLCVVSNFYPFLSFENIFHFRECFDENILWSHWLLFFMTISIFLLWCWLFQIFTRFWWHHVKAIRKWYHLTNATIYIIPFVLMKNTLRIIISCDHLEYRWEWEAFGGRGIACVWCSSSSIDMCRHLPFQWNHLRNARTFHAHSSHLTPFSDEMRYFLAARRTIHRNSRPDCNLFTRKLTSLCISRNYCLIFAPGLFRFGVVAKH